MKRPRMPICLVFCLLILPMTGCCKQDAQPRAADKPSGQIEKRPIAPDTKRQEETVPPVAPSGPTPTTTPAESPDAAQSAGAATSQPVKEEPREPKRPKDTWVIFREAIEDKADADIKAKWRGGNKFDIETTNVRRLTIDMTKLPDGPPKKGPWIIQIDDQGIELTGFKPRPGYTGHIRDLVRSKNGVWDVDRKRLYRLGG